MPTNYIALCGNCRCMRLEFERWVDVNRDNKTVNDGLSDEAWCPKCEREVKNWFSVERTPCGKWRGYDSEEPMTLRDAIRAQQVHS